MYAIVRASGRQEKVSVGDELEVNRLAAEPGSVVELPAVLVVDSGTVTADRDALGSVKVTAEVLSDTKGPKIQILKYKIWAHNRKSKRRQEGRTVDVDKIDIPDRVWLNALEALGR